MPTQVIVRRVALSFVLNVNAKVKWRRHFNRQPVRLGGQTNLKLV